MQPQNSGNVYDLTIFCSDLAVKLQKHVHHCCLLFNIISQSLGSLAATTSCTKSCHKWDTPAVFHFNKFILPTGREQNLYKQGKGFG